MHKPNFIPIVIFFILLPVIAISQVVDYDASYAAAKAKLTNGNHQAAIYGFKELMTAHPAHKKSPYTMFYYGVASYHIGEVKKSKDIFLQLMQRNPDWDKLPEVYLWLSKVSFELESPNQGMYYANRIEDENYLEYASELQKSYLSRLNQVTLALLLSEHEEDTLIATLLASKMTNLKPFERDIDSLSHLITRYKLDSIEIGLGYPEDVFKEKYKVAVILPLFIDRLWHSGVYMHKSLAVDIYEGIQLALSEFDTSRINIELFDSKRSASVVSEILKQGRLADVDAIIGPLYPEPIEVVSQYSFDHEINVINPVSINTNLTRSNPYYFLLRTGAESMGKIAAEYTSRILEERPYAIYSGTRVTDTLSAFYYRENIEADSFQTVIDRKVETSNARSIFDNLTFAKQVVDSAALQRMYDNGENVQFLPLKDSLFLPQDSLGHIFISSDNKTIASEVMAAITSRGDTTQLVGLGNWFSFPNAGFDVMESLGIWLAMQEFENMLLPQNLALAEKYRGRYFEKPSKYVYYGYYAMKFIGESLLEYGVYFQNGYRIKGNLDPMFDYRNSQDNQRLVIYTMKEGKPILVDNLLIDKIVEQD